MKQFEKNLLVLMGVVLFALLVFTSFFKGNHNHFEMHTNSGRMLVQEIVPYAKSLNDSASGGMASWWLYSPTAALSFYPFAVLPPSVGLFVYLFLSTLLFGYGIYFFLKTLGIPYDTKGLRWLYLPAFSELIGGLQSEKPEVAMVGLVLLAGAFLVRKQWWLGALLLALPTVWKVQPLAIGGLVSLALLRNESRGKDALKFSGAYAVSIAAFLLLPLLFVSYSFLSEAFASWWAALNIAIRDTWHGNVTFYNLLKGYFGFPSNPTQVRVVGLAVAALFAVVVVMRRLPSVSGIGLALGLGSIYGVLLSPLSQGTTYVFGTPALLVAVLLVLASKKVLWIVLTHWVVTSIVWSDLVPDFVSVFFASFNARPWGFVLLAAYLIYELGFNRRDLQNTASLLRQVEQESTV